MDDVELPNIEEFQDGLAKETAQAIKDGKIKLPEKIVEEDKPLRLSRMHFLALKKEILRNEFNEEKTYSDMNAWSMEWREMNDAEKKVSYLDAERYAKKGIEKNQKQSEAQLMTDKVTQEVLTSTSPELIATKILDNIPIYYDKNKLFWLWNKDLGIWELCDDIDTIVTARRIFDIPGLNRLRKDIIEFIKIIGRERKPLDPPSNWIQFGNKIYDIISGKEFPSDFTYFFTNALPFTPSNDSSTPFLDKLFIEWVGLENVDLLYQIIAYCCYRDYPIHHLFCFVGSGSNGKSSFLNIVSKFIGMRNVSSVSLDKLMGNDFASSMLYKKLVCQMGETNFNTMSKTDLLKRLTGDDVVDFEFKNKNPFVDKNYAKILISTNTLPETTDKTEGFYRRWVIIDFLNRFTGDTDILSYIPEYEFNNLSRKVIEILPKLLSERRFFNIGTVEDRRKKYEDKSNPLPRFISEKCVNDIEGSIPKWLFAQRLNDYLLQNNLRKRSDTEIGISMNNLGYEDKKSYKIEVENGETKEKRVWVWLDIKWKEDEVKINESTV